MKVFITLEIKKKILKFLKEKNQSRNIDELSNKLGISKKTLEGWFYIPKRGIPEEFLKKNAPNFSIIEKREDNWGQVSGGKEGYARLVKKYGKKKADSFRLVAGREAAEAKDKNSIFSRLKLDNILFLELYGALLGDGWLCSQNRKESRWAMGLCGHLKLDSAYIHYLSKNIWTLLNRKGYFNEKAKSNVLEFRFKHKNFFILLNDNLNFPAGKKENLLIPNVLMSQGYGKIRHIIRGIFDTDGSFYLDRDRHGIPVYPCISIHMTEPLLMKQIADILNAQGFRLSFDEKNNQIKLKGSKQLKKWLDEIGSSNPSKLIKMQRALSNLVASL